MDAKIKFILENKPINITDIQFFCLILFFRVLNHAGDSGLSLRDLMLPPPMDIWSNLTDLTLDLLKSLEEQAKMTRGSHQLVVTVSVRSH